MATKEFTTYMHERTQDFFPDGPVDFGITRKNDGTVKKVRVWRFGAQATTGEPVPAENSIDLTNLEDDDGTILPTDDVADTFLIEMEEGQMRWIKFNNGGGRIIGNELLLVPGNVINLAAGDMIQVVGLAGGITQVLQYVKAVGTGDVEGVPPIGWIELDTNPDEDDTKDVNGITVTFKNSPGAFPEVQRGADAEDTTTNLVAALNAATDEELITATYVAYGSKTVIIHDAGTDGNAFDLTGGTADFTTSDSTLVGGEDGVDQAKAGKSLVAFVPVQVNYAFQDDLETSPDTGLEVEIEEPGRYKIDLFVRSKAQNSALKFDFAGTATIDAVSGGGFPVKWIAVSTFGTVRTERYWGDPESSPDFSDFDTLDNTIYELTGSVLFTTAGTFRLRAAMIVSEAGNTTIRVGSFLELRPLF